MEEEKSLIELAREKTALAKKHSAEVDQKIRERKKQEEEELRQRMEKRAEELFTQCKAEILAEAAKGKNQARYKIFSDSQENYPLWAQFLTPLLKKKLLEEGFAVKEKHEKIEPAIGDSRVKNTGYSLYLIIGWVESAP
ncbi:MAG: hypothetical protein HYT37_03515 [Candidatus Sungbacteria bacterium]|nr:hypothetical protein [Candidatus Sungbacteria bacterium]